MRARRTGRNRGVIRALRVVAHGHEAGRDVGDEHRNEERADLARPALAIDVVLLLEALEATDAAAEDHADAIRIVHGRIGECRVGHCLCRAGQGVLCVGVSTLGFLPIHVLQWIEALHLTREAHGELRRVELRDRAGSRNAVDKGTPGRRHVVPDGRDRPKTGDDDPTLH